MSRWIRLLILCALAAGQGAVAESVFRGAERLVAIGDVHGDYDQFVKLLRQAGLIDEKEKWAGGRSHFVQTGDVPDRGPDTRKILDLLMDLEKQAKKAGGRVYPLIGNHEAMNMYGDLRYVTPEEFAAFSSANAQRLQDLAYQLHVQQLEQQGALATPGDEAKWRREHPLGYVEHRREWAPDGEYGKWVRKNNAVIQVGDTIFLHGGWSPKYADWQMQDLNDQIQKELADFTKLKGGVTVDSEGPLWYRGLAQDAEAPLLAHVDALLTRHNAKRIVIGHTPTAGTVMPRFGGKVLLIDVGLSAAYGSRMACLIIEDGRPYVLHRGHRLELPKDDSTAEMLRYLSTAAALDPQPSPLAQIIESLTAQPQSK